MQREGMLETEMAPRTAAAGAPGRVEAIHIATREGGVIRAVDAVRAVPGQGLEGDRYFTKAQAGPLPKPGQELTLIEAEAIEAFNAEYAKAMTPAQSRRNVVTRGVALNDLVGREFEIGSVRAKGIRLCEPCTLLQKLAMPEVIPGLVHKAGLRAEILTEGVLEVGDGIRAIE